MSTDSGLCANVELLTSGHNGGRSRSWWLRRLCSQNPFYLLSVCFVLHGTSHWFHSDSGVSFSPWPLLAVTAGYTLLLAVTGFVIVRFGKVWDDARSILLIILLLFVQLSLIFDETLVREPVVGRLLLCTGWAFSIVVSELLLRGLRIGLPWLFRVPYHALLALLFLYPLFLVSPGSRLPMEVVAWRIFLFPPVASLVLLTLIPAIRRGQTYTKRSGTPWLWPWYPWSLFVFLGVCLCFRAYSLSLSFDPVLGESLASALDFSSTFGVYFLVPIAFAAGVLLLEIGLVERQPRTIRLAMFVPVLCLWLSIPATNASGPYAAFVRTVTTEVGSPVWLTLLGAIAFYGLARLRRVPSSDVLFASLLLVATRVGPQTINLETLTIPAVWPLVTLAVVELVSGLLRGDSHRVFVASLSAIAAVYAGLSPNEELSSVHLSSLCGLMFVVAVLTIGALFRDEFAWMLRVVGSPLIVLTAALTVCVENGRFGREFPGWSIPAAVFALTVISFGYAMLVGVKLYHVSGILCALTGSLDMIFQWVVYLIQNTGWHGAASFAIGLAWFAIAALVSSWKAGWLKRVIPSFKNLLTVNTAFES